MLRMSVTSDITKSVEHPQNAPSRIPIRIISRNLKFDGPNKGFTEIIFYTVMKLVMLLDTQYYP